MAIEKAGVELTAIDNATRVFNQVKDSAKKLEKGYDDLKHAVEAGIAAFAIDRIVHETVEWEQATNRLNATLRATGDAVGFTRKQLDEMAHSIEGSTIFGDRDIKNAQANLIKFGNIHDQVFSEALKLSADYAAFTGGDMASASQALGRALADPMNGLKALQREFGNLTFTQKQYIEQLLAQGKTEEAQAAILDIVRNKIGGTAAGANQGLTGFVSLLGKAWEHVAVAAGSAVSAMMKAARPEGELLDFGPVPEARARGGSIDDQVEQEEAQRASRSKKRQEAIDREAEARQKAIPILRTWTKMLGDQTNEQRALDLVLEGEAKLWNDREKAILLNIAVELDWRRVAKDRMDLAEREAKALQEFRDGTLSEEENLATRVKVVQDQWMKGTRDTFQDYIKHAKDGAEQAAFFFRNAFQNMEDALVEFAMTGKINFRNFANQVIADLIRIQVRQQLAGFASNAGIAGFAGGFGGSFFGFGTTAPGLEVHSGGVIGEGGGRPRQVDPAWFANAPRMHMGGLAGDEVPAILQKGERVIPRGGSAGVVIQIHQTIGNNVSNVDLAAVAAAGRQGAMAAIAEERKRNPRGAFGG